MSKGDKKIDAQISKEEETARWAAIDWSKKYDNDKIYAQILSFMKRVPDDVFVNNSTHSQGGIPIREVLKRDGQNVSNACGRCFPFTKMYFYMMGGADSGFKVMRINKAPYANLTTGELIQTTHWYLQNKDTDRITDVTGSQFIYGYLPKYEKGRRADFGSCYLAGRGKDKKFPNVVPSQEVIAMAELFKEINGTAYGMDFWIEENYK